MAAIGVVIFLVFMFASRSRGQAIIIPKPMSASAWLYVRFMALVVVPLACGLGGLVSIAFALVLLLAPLVLLRLIVVPLGRPMIAYWMARCCWPIGSTQDLAVNATLFGALTLARNPRSAHMVDWLDLKLGRMTSPRGAAVVTAGLLAALRGDRQLARGLFLVADTLAGRQIPRSARVVARDWLVVDAARVGDWREVIRLGCRGKGSRRWSYAVARIAERLVDDPQSSPDWQLWAFWAMAPRRRATLPLLRRAMATRPAAAQAVTEPSEAADLPHALAGLARACANRASADGESLGRAAGEIDAQLEGEQTRALVQRRLLALGARGEEAILPSVRQRLADLLAPLLEHSPHLAGEHRPGTILAQATERVRTQLFRDIDSRCKDYDNRRKTENALSILEEWKIWALTRTAADCLLKLGPDSAGTLFLTMYVPVCNFAVFQQNKLKRTALAHDMYAWLLLHCHGDAAAAQLLQGNVRASRA
jgi:hypothetical protein